MSRLTTTNGAHREEPPPVTHGGVSDLHEVKVDRAATPAQDALVTQSIYVIDGKRYGGTLCRCGGRTPDQANRQATHIMELHNINAARLRGEIK